MSLEVVPLTLRQAQEFVQQHHRHNKPPHGCKFALGVRAAGNLVGVATAGRPVARALDDGRTLEVNRSCTDGTPHANSMLYGAIWRAAKAMGYVRCITYTQAEESGASLRAVGWVRVKELEPRGDWVAGSVKHRHLREPAQGTFIEDERRRTGGVARVLWEIRAMSSGTIGRPGACAQLAAAHAPGNGAIPQRAADGFADQGKGESGLFHGAMVQPETAGATGVRVLDEAQLRERIAALQADAAQAGFTLLASYAKPNGDVAGVALPDGGQKP